jgi:hypothetical protein
MRYRALFDVRLGKGPRLHGACIGGLTLGRVPPFGGGTS